MATPNTSNTANANWRAGVLNNYTVMPKNLTQYNAFRGVTDFTQIGQFNQFEKGYSFLSVIAMPKFIEVLAKQDDEVAKMCFSFKHKLEYEFRGLSGLTDVTAQTNTITDGINEVAYINRVTMDTSITVTMPYFENTGSLITKFSEYYLTGIKDRISQAKTYHGAIRAGLIEPGLENEVFTLLYYVTDNTMLSLERAVLLANCQLTQATVSNYDGSREDIGTNVPYDISFTAFPIMGTMVDKAAKALLEEITGVKVSPTKVGSPAERYTDVNAQGTYLGPETMGNHSKPIYTAYLDSADYLYGIMDETLTSASVANTKLTDAIANSTSDSETDNTAYNNIKGWRAQGESDRTKNLNTDTNPFTT